MAPAAAGRWRLSHRVPPRVPKRSSCRGCTDVVCCVLLVLAIVGYVVVGIVGTYPVGGLPHRFSPRRQAGKLGVATAVPRGVVSVGDRSVPAVARGIKERGNHNRRRSASSPAQPGPTETPGR